MKTSHIKLIDQSPLRLGSLLISLVFVCFALSPTARAVDPPPDGGYPNQNTAEGEDALFSLTTGVDNTANGFEALFNNTIGNFNTANGSFALGSNIIGDSNTANGYAALFNNTHGNFNTATGAQALFRNTGGNFNTANGAGSLFRNASGFSNTAIGVNALYRNTTGHFNTATGFQALSNNTGNFNTATGSFALYSNDGSYNTASGYHALSNNTTGQNNTANGVTALEHNTTGSNNTATGSDALHNSTTGSSNTAIGNDALFVNQTGNFNTAIGDNALHFNVTGSDNIALGYNAGVNLGERGEGNIVIGNVGIAGESSTIRIGNRNHIKTVISGIRGVTTQNADAIPVMIDSAGQLGTMSSSRRFKKEIKPMDQTSEAILGLKPVTFHYKSDPAGAGPQFGLIAEEVAQVNPDLVVRDENGEVYTVRYEAVNAMLLNEFLKEHRKNEQQQAMIARLGKQLEALTAGLQKVSAQLEVNKPAPQTVLNNQ